MTMTNCDGGRALNNITTVAAWRAAISGLRSSNSKELNDVDTTTETSQRL